jgi:hypothetical protein
MPRGAGSMHTVMNGCMQDLGRSKKVVVPLDNIASLGSLPTRYDIPGLLDWAGLHRYAAFVAVLQAPGLVVGGVGGLTCPILYAPAVKRSMSAGRMRERTGCAGRAQLTFRSPKPTTADLRS